MRLLFRSVGNGLKTQALLFALTAAAVAAPPEPVFGQPLHDVALAIVYDTSGSMRETIRTADGERAPKHVVADRALRAVGARLEAFTAASAPHTLALGLYVFRGKGVIAALPLAPFSGAALRGWLDRQGEPDNATPLGLAIERAGRDLLACPAAHKHLLVITDGENTTGLSPVAAVDHLRQEAAVRQQSIFIHLIALDVPPSVFSTLQQHGVTLISAANEKQLTTELDFILENKVLLETQ